MMMLQFSACALLVASFLAASAQAKQGAKTRQGSPNLRSPHHQQRRALDESPQIAKLQLIHAGTNNAIADLADGAVIELSALGMAEPFFNIEAVVASEGQNNGVGSVRFALDDIDSYRTENVVPYALCGDTGGDFYNCQILALGTHTVTATPFAERGASGTAGSPLTVTFTIVSGNAPAKMTAAPVPAAPTMSTTAPLPVVDTPTSAPVVAPTSPTPTIGITGFKLIYAPTNEEVLDLENSSVVSLQDLGLPTASFNVMAETAEGSVKSVSFQQNGRTERAQPFAYCGDIGGSYFTCDEFVVGSTNTVTATAFTNEGTALNDVSITFSIIAGPLSEPTIKVGAPVSASTKAPTLAPVTTSPTAAPMQSPTAAPLTYSPTTTAPVTTSPTAAPVQSPTAAPSTESPTTTAPVTTSPTRAPVQSPTMAPSTDSPTTTAPVTTSPTRAPVQSPTAAPSTDSPTTTAPVTTSPTRAPVQSPTAAPLTESPTTTAPVTTSPTRAPVSTPTRAPTEAPTGAPDEPTAMPTKAPTDAPVDNRYDITQDLLMAESEKQVFISAAARWEQVVTGDLEEFESSRLALGPRAGCTYPAIIDDLYICGAFQFIDGKNKQIGFGKVTFLRPDTNLPVAGEMIFDQDDLETLRNLGLLETLILHEMGHVMGIGTAWVDVGIQESGNTPCTYTGPIATAKFKEISGCDEIPIEQTGLSATRCRHWDEGCFNLELMTGELDLGFSPLSEITIGNLEDMGYQVSYDFADAFTRADLNPNIPGCVCDRRDLTESQTLVDKEHGKVFMLDNQSEGQGRSLEEVKVPLSEENYQYALQAGYDILDEAAALQGRTVGGNDGAVSVGDRVVSIYMLQNDTVYGVLVMKED